MYYRFGKTRYEDMGPTNKRDMLSFLPLFPVLASRLHLLHPCPDPSVRRAHVIQRGLVYDVADIISPHQTCVRSCSWQQLLTSGPSSQFSASRGGSRERLTANKRVVPDGSFSDPPVWVDRGRHETRTDRGTERGLRSRSGVCTCRGRLSLSGITELFDEELWHGRTQWVELLLVLTV
jgi:hypothetical protein